MHPTIKDKATSKTGGVTNQCPKNHHQIERTPKAGILWLTRTFQCGMRPAPTKKYETNPISVRARHAVPQLCETNPIAPPLLPFSSSPLLPPPSSIMQNKPNLLPGHDPNIRNEPNLPSPRPKYSKQTQFTTPRLAQDPKNAKRTQFRPAVIPPRCPKVSQEFIPTCRGFIGEPNLLHHQVPRHPLFQRNEPNPGTTMPETNPISAPPHASCLHYAKRTQSPPHAVFPPFSSLLSPFSSRGQQPAPTNFCSCNQVAFDV